MLQYTCVVAYCEKCLFQTDQNEEASENEASDGDESESENTENGKSPLVDHLCIDMYSDTMLRCSN